MRGVCSERIRLACVKLVSPSTVASIAERLVLYASIPLLFNVSCLNRFLDMNHSRDTKSIHYSMSMSSRNGYQKMVLPWAFILVMASPMGVIATPGPTNPNIHADYNKLPALEKAKMTPSSRRPPSLVDSKLFRSTMKTCHTR